MGEKDYPRQPAEPGEPPSPSPDGEPAYGRPEEQRTGQAVPPPGWGPDQPAGTPQQPAMQVAWAYDQPPSATWGEPAALRDGPAWEWRGQLGYGRAAYLTFREVFASPDQAFSRAIRDGGLGSSFSYYLIMGYVFGLLGFLANWPLQSVVREFMGPFGAGDARSAGEFPLFFQYLMEPSSATAFLLQVFLLPISLTVYLFLTSGIFHVMLMLFGGARQPFETTFRTVAYAQGTVAVLQIVPIIGPMVSSLIGLIFYIIGLARMHETSMWRSTLAILAPVVLVFMFVLMLIVAFVGIWGLSQA